MAFAGGVLAAMGGQAEQKQKNYLDTLAEQRFQTQRLDQQGVQGEHKREFDASNDLANRELGQRGEQFNQSYGLQKERLGMEAGADKREADFQQYRIGQAKANIGATEAGTAQTKVATKGGEIQNAFERVMGPIRIGTAREEERNAVGRTIGNEQGFQVKMAALRHIYDAQDRESQAQIAAGLAYYNSTLSRVAAVDPIKFQAEIGRTGNATAGLWQKLITPPKASATSMHPVALLDPTAQATISHFASVNAASPDPMAAALKMLKDSETEPPKPGPGATPEQIQQYQSLVKANQAVATAHEYLLQAAGLATLRKHAPSWDQAKPPGSNPPPFLVPGSPSMSPGGGASPF